MRSEIATTMSGTSQGFTNRLTRSTPGKPKHDANFGGRTDLALKLL
jgi:hypothetical protein